jgi:hypothetical protein
MGAYGQISLSQAVNTVVNGYFKGYASVIEAKTLPIDQYVPASAIIDLSTMKMIGKNVFNPSQIINKCNNK